MIATAFLAAVLAGGWTADGVEVEIPHTWNATDAADGDSPDIKRKDRPHPSWSFRTNAYARKRVVYSRALPDVKPGAKAFVRVNGASQTAVVSVNGKELATHRGAFTPFTVDVTDALKPEGGNVLEIAVDNFDNADIPPVSADFSLFGGLYRPVEFFEGAVPAPAACGKPRKAEFRADGFYLDGVRTPLRGVNRHQDRKGKGWAISPEDEAEDVALMKEMGANVVRTAHYPTSENFYRLCDEAGIMVISEASGVDHIPSTPGFRENYLNEIREMVAAFKHHPCIIAWGLFNEVQTPDRAAAPLVAEGAALLRELDPDRPVYGVAHTDSWGKRVMQKPLDVVGFNIYPGWYSHRATDVTNILDRCCSNSGRANIMITEYGAGASVNHHDLSLKKPGASFCNFHPEEYQAYALETMYRYMSRDPRVYGTFVWCMFDFASDLRNEGESAGMNDKGLVTYDRKTRKDAFYFYKANWTETPVLHIVGSRGTETKVSDVNVRVYSNVGPVELAVNGKIVGTVEPDEVKTCVFNGVKLSPGANTVTARAGGREASANWELK